MATIFAALIFLSLSLDVHAQSWWDYLNETPERIIGLLDLPHIAAGGCGPAPKRATARVYRAPSQNGPAAGTIYWHQIAEIECSGLMIERTGGIKEALPTLESDYEVPAAIVYERHGSWFRIALKTGSVWIRHEASEDFLSYPDMLKEQLPFIPQGWDGILRATPSHTGAVTPLSGWRDLLDRGLSVQYLGSQRVDKDLWIHIRLAAKSACDHTYEGVTDVSGWIPAYRNNGAPAAWFSSRGC